MSDEARVVAAFVLPLLTAVAVIPFVIRVALRTGFEDRPGGHKGHSRPTPYLGGAAVIGAVLVASFATAGDLDEVGPLVGLAIPLWLLGTIDDRVTLTPGLRVLATAVCAAALWLFDLGWSFTGSDAVDLVLTVGWVVALVNAFNLMDNMDGAAGTVAAVTGAAVGLLALLNDQLALAALGFCLAGACSGFLFYNLANPPRIFLGDGGSMPVGFLVAGLIMAVPHEDPGWHLLVAATLLAGLPLLDTTLVVISRRRRGVSFLAGGTDHLTHRLRTRLPSARFVAVVLGTVQAVIGAIAVGAVEAGRESVISAGVIWFFLGAASVAVLESRDWAGSAPPRRSAPETPRARTPRRFSVNELLTVAVIALVCVASPFLFGFYDLTWWGPITLVVLAVLLGFLLARPAALRPVALAALAGIAVLWAWSLLSVGWAESSHQAALEANRWVLYAAAFAVLALLIRDDRTGSLVLGATAAAPLVLAGYVVVKGLAGNAESLFLLRRLHEPLGYANGQATYLLLGLWPLVAVAEAARRRAVAGAAITLASVLASVALLTQTRAIVPAVLVAALVVVALFPGRARRLWILLFVAAGAAIAAPAVLDVYSSSDADVPSAGAIRNAIVWTLAGAVIAGAAWVAVQLAAAQLGRGARKALSANGTLSTAGLVTIGVVAFFAAAATVGNPFERAGEEWDNFTELRDDSSDSRFSSAGGNRYDYWRIAVHQFEDEPLHGIGAGNYDRDYYLERETTEEIRQPHSLPLQTLAELGLVGGVALLLFVGAVLVGLVRRVVAIAQRRQSPFLVLAATGTFVIWLVHSAVDWPHLIPGISLIALAAAAVLVGPWRRERGPGGRRQLVVGVAAAAVVLFAAVGIARLTLADHHRAQGRELLSADPTGALERAQDSLSLADESLPAHYLKAAAYARMNDYRRARETLLLAAELEPHDHVPWALLGDLAMRRGELDAAERSYRRASELNPRDAGLRALAENVR